jgi:hypothetical protein
LLSLFGNRLTSEFINYLENYLQNPDNNFDQDDESVRNTVIKRINYRGRGSAENGSGLRTLNYRRDQFSYIRRIKQRNAANLEAENNNRNTRQAQTRGAVNNNATRFNSNPTYSKRSRTPPNNYYSGRYNPSATTKRSNRTNSPNRYNPSSPNNYGGKNNPISRANTASGPNTPSGPNRPPNRPSNPAPVGNTPPGRDPAPNRPPNPAPVGNTPPGSDRPPGVNSDNSNIDDLNNFIFDLLFSNIASSNSTTDDLQFGKPYEDLSVTVPVKSRCYHEYFFNKTTTEEAPTGDLTCHNDAVISTNSHVSDGIFDVTDETVDGSFLYGTDSKNQN